MSGIADLLRVARSQIGVAEKPAGSNHTPYGLWYPMDGVAWCAIFVSWCAAQSGNAGVIPKFAYCPTGADIFKAAGRWGTEPRVGAVAFYDIAGLNRQSHVGLVEALLPNRRWYSIEGNTNGSGSRTGGEVWRQNRSSVGRLGGFGYPLYPTVVKPAVQAVPQPDSAPASPPQYPGRVLERGVRSNDVLIAQKRLKEHADGAGYAFDYSSAPGLFGPLTEACVRWYQSCRHGAPYNLEIDGRIGPMTWNSLWR